MKKILLCFSLLWSALAFGQGFFVSPQVALKTVNGVTAPIASATITVCGAGVAGIPCSPPLVNAVFKDAALSLPLSNPATADANGNYSFAIAAGTYTVTVSASGFAGQSYQITEGAGITNGLIVAPGSTIQQAINTVNPAGAGGIVYVPAGTYVGPTSIPDNTSIICPSAPTNSNMLGAWGVNTGTAATQCDFTYSAQLNLTIHNVHFVGITFDFQHSTTNGLNLISSSYNIFDDDTLMFCGGTACLQITTTGSGVAQNSVRNEFNRLRIATTNSTPSIGYTGILLNGASASVTLNRFTGLDIVSNLLCGIDFEKNTDTNLFEDVQINQDAPPTISNSAPLCFNLLTPGSDQDSDANTISGMAATGYPAKFTSFLRAGQTTGNRIIATNNQQGAPVVSVVGGVPSFSYESVQLSGGFNEILSQRISAGSVPAASGSGDLTSAESTTVGKVFLGTGGQDLSAGSGVPSGNCVVGSVYMNGAATSASTVIYRCWPANTWTAVP